MDAYLTDCLRRLSEQTEIAHREAVRAGREDVAAELSKLGMKVATLLVRSLRGELAKPDDDAMWVPPS